MKSILHDEDFIATNLPKELPAVQAAPVEDGGVAERFFKVKDFLPDEVTVVKPKKSSDYPASFSRTFYIAPTGDDKGDGSEDAPFATLDRAISAMEGKPGARIVFRGGIYTLKAGFKLDGAQNQLATKDAPLFIEAYPGEKPELTASYGFSGKDFAPVSEKNTDSEMLSRFNTFIPNNTANIYVADLVSLGFTPDMYGENSPSGTPILYIDGEAKTLVRYPNANEPMLATFVSNEDILKQPRVAAIASQNYAKYKDATDGFKLRISPENAFYSHMSKWKKTDDIWAALALYAEWERGRYQLTLTDGENGALVAECSTNCRWGLRYTEYNDGYYYNVAEELDADGEWYLDRKEGKLYIWLTAPLAPDARVSFVTKTLHCFDLSHIKNTVISGFTFWGTLGSAIRLTESENVLIQNCEVHDVMQAGMLLTKIRSCGVIHSDFHHTTSVMLKLIGVNDRKSMTPDRNFIQNCRFYDPMTQAEVHMAGVMCCASHNHFHEGLLYGGGYENFFEHNCESIIEYNEFDRGSQTSFDSGPYYCSGFPSEGIHIRYNYFHNINHSDIIVYIDDMACGNYIYGNILAYGYDGPTDRGLGVHLHCGAQNVMYNNIVVNTARAGISDSVNYCVKDVLDEKGEKMNVQHRIYSCGEVKDTYEVYWAGSNSPHWPVMSEATLNYYYDFFEGEGYNRRFPNSVIRYGELAKHIRNRAAKGEQYDPRRAYWSFTEQKGCKYPWGNQPLADFLDSQPDDTREIYLRSTSFSYIANNVYLGCTCDINQFCRWNVLTSVVQDNLGLNKEDTRFAQAMAGDYAALAKPSMWQAVIPHFEAIPFEKMGLTRK